MIKYLLPLFIILFYQGYGQGFELSNSFLQKKLILNSTSIVEISFTYEKEAIETMGFNKGVLRGKINLINNDSLSLDINSIKFYKDEKATNLSSEYNWKVHNSPFELATKDIDYLHIFSSERNLKRKNTLSTIGSIVFFCGALTSINALFIKDKESRQTVLLSAAAQVGLGMTLGFSQVKRKYKFKNGENSWTFINE
ncbi:MAG TPA: hypothetical protein PKD85_04835 [Saprospiraceae bacterium]|nr:hypothetical protein [Saprospiraceae bacterium]